MSPPLVDGRPYRVRVTSEIGLVEGDERRHAVKPTVNGRRAVCGAGAITAQVPGRFDAGDPGACPACAEVLTQAG